MEENLSNDNISNEKFSLLDSFFKEKILQYDEPQRKGTPRGEPIGFSEKKYYAALMMLKKFPLKELAGILKVSYGLLRKWRTEDQFIEQIKKNESDFTLRVFKHLDKRGEKQKKLRDDYFNKSVDYIAATYPPSLTWNEFLDLKFYSPNLVVTIATRLHRHYSEKYKEAVKRLDDIELGKLDDEWSDDDILLLSVSFQIKTFYETIIASYTVKTKKEISELAKELETSGDERRKTDARTIQFIIANQWLRTGTISELAIKKAIYTIHDLSGNYTPVDMDC